MSNKPAELVKSNIATTLLGGVFILAGIMFLIGRYLNQIFDFHIDIGHYAWPFFIIIPGIMLFVTAFLFGRSPGVVLAVIGATVTTTGVILLVQNTFDIYASWAYAWTLVVPTAVGAAKLAYGIVRGQADEVRSGLNLVGIGLGMFVIGGLFFELVIGINGIRFAAAWVCLPVLLIGFGIVLLSSSLIPRRKRQTPVE